MESGYSGGGLDNWGLEPSLQRICADWGVPKTDIPTIERRLLREFKRAYPRNTSDPPPVLEDDLAWLALMQHHGTPTRLLDWTFSPFVAAFFALDLLLACREKDRLAAVWALYNRPVSNQAVKAFLPGNLQKAFVDYSENRDGKAFRTLFLEAQPAVAFATPVNPYALNERLVVQQGTFICPGDVTRDFEENLLAMPGVSEPANLRKILLPRSVLSTAFVTLRRMNVTHATLFPGLDGYARSLRHAIGFLQTAELFDPTKY